MDNLTYGYNKDANGRLVNNRLRHIKDAVSAGNYSEDLDSQPDDNYSYDPTGNLTGDSQAGISKIDWTVYGKIRSITKTDGTRITYNYDPAGNRVSKTTGGLMTWYVRDAQGNTLGIYDNRNCQTNWKEQQLYGSSRLGMWKPNVNLNAGRDSTVWDSTGHKFFELSNHLGNVLAVISDKRIQQGSGDSVDYYQADIVSAQDYYPFGMLMPERTYSSGSYRYGFNGKENDNEVKGEGNQQDYGFRIYDPRLGRFLSVDPLTKKYPELTPYQFASNTPIQAIDLDGLEMFLVNGYDGYSSRTKFSGDPDDYKRMLKYWTNNNPSFIQQASERFKETDVRFLDGSQGLRTGHGSVKVRHDAGYEMAMALVNAKQVDFSKPITIIAHSMGGAYADGMTDGFLKNKS